MVELGLLLGGLFRLAPEVLNFFGKKTDNKHELELLKEQAKLEETRTNKQMEAAKVEGNFQLLTNEILGLRTALEEQGKPSGIKWIDGASKLVRPFLTYWWCVILYSIALGAGYLSLISGGISSVDAILRLWGPEEKAIVANIFSFWFVDRAIRYSKAL